MYRQTDDRELVDHLRPFLEQLIDGPADAATLARVELGMTSLKARARSLVELAQASMIYCPGRPNKISEKAQNLLNSEAITALNELADQLAGNAAWDEPALDSAVRALER